MDASPFCQHLLALASIDCSRVSGLQVLRRQAMPAHDELVTR